MKKELLPGRPPRGEAATEEDSERNINRKEPSAAQPQPSRSFSRKGAKGAKKKYDSELCVLGGLAR